jgi:hypothetical protein
MPDVDLSKYQKVERREQERERERKCDRKESEPAALPSQSQAEGSTSF